MQGNKISFSYAVSEMSRNGDKIKAWAKQDNNLLLKACAREVIEVFEAGR